MGRVNQLYQDDLERRAELYMQEHPDADPADAFDAADPQQRFHERGDAMADKYEKDSGQ